MSYPTENAAFYTWVNGRKSLLVPKTVEFTLSSAQILLLNATPVLIIPAPATGKVLIFLGGVLHYKAGATPYTIGGGSYFAIGTNPTTTEFINALVSGIIDQATDKYVPLVPETSSPTLPGTAAYAFLTAAATVGDGTIEGVISYVEAEV